MNSSGTGFSSGRFSVLGYSGGDGSIETPYVLSIPNDLVSFSNNIDSLMDQDAYFKLSNDIDMTGVNWTYGIGKISTRIFKGTLDGNGYKISNLTGSPTNQAVYGLFELS